MSTDRVSSTAAMCCAVMLSGCSVVVDELTLSCMEQSDCDALNAKHGLDLTKDCFVYQCRPDGRGCEQRAQDLDGDRSPAPVCEGKVGAKVDCDDGAERGAARRPGGEERCDGEDNDCDGFIDEDVLDASTLKPASTPFIDVQHVVHVSHASGIDGMSYLALTREEPNDFVTTVFKYTAGDPNDQPEHGDVGRNCTGVMCKFAELVLAAAPNLVLGLGVNRSGCGAGEMRTGATHSWDMGTANGFVWTPAPVSTCPLRGTSEGASRASLGLLAPSIGRRQGLALWRAGRDDDDAALAGAGLWVDSRSGEPPAVQRIGAEAEPIASSEGHDPAAVVSWLGRDGGGYFVAYDAADVVELAFIPQLADGSPFLIDESMRGDPIEETAPRQVVLTLDPDGDASRDEPRGLAAAWRTAAGEVRFAKISFARSARPQLAAETRLTLQSGVTILEGPELVYLPLGFLSEGADREGRTGGWFVTWLEHDGVDRIVGARVAEANGEVHGPFRIFEGKQLRHLFAHRAAPSVPAYGFIAAGPREQLHIGSLTCAPTN